MLKEFKEASDYTYSAENRYFKKQISEKKVITPPSQVLINAV